MKTLRRLALALMALTLAACASGPGPEALTQVAAAPGARQVVVYVATTRQRAAPGVNLFTDDRSLELAYAEFAISVPPGHKPGEIEWPGATPDPNATFAVVGQRVLGAAAFEAAAGRQAGRRREVDVFVHGFNVNFQDALFRMAQMAADAGGDGAPILFAWPSEGRITSYVADKDAAAASRDQLAALLTALTRNPRIDCVMVMGHSMGGWLTAEALRQLRLTGQDAVIRRLNVILAAPDIDVDVFRAQLATIGPLSPPMTLLVSRDDRALSVSRLLASERPRVGAADVADPRIAEAARQANVEVVDISALNATDGLNHNRFAAMAALYPKLAAEQASGADLRRPGAFVLDALGATLASPFTLTGQAMSGQ